MIKILRFGLFLLLATGVVACGSGREGDDDDDSSSSDDDDTGGDDLLSIPDPGDEYAPFRWYDDGGYHGTPQTAQAMGIVLEIPEYIQGGIDPETGNHFFVFRTGPDQTDFRVNLHNASSEIEHVHIHDGTGLVFGEEVEPLVVFSAVAAAWELETDTVYVLEVHSPSGGFF